MFFADELDSLVKGFQSLTVQDPVYDLAECLSRFSIEEPPLSQVDWSASMDWEPTYLDLVDDPMDETPDDLPQGDPMEL